MFLWLLLPTYLFQWWFCLWLWCGLHIQGWVGLCVLLVCVFCGGCGWFVWDVGGSGVGKSDVVCCSVALMVLGICLYMCRNSSGVSMPMVYGF